MITFVGSSFSMSVPSDWLRMATPEHLVVFLDTVAGGSGATITVSRHGVRAGVAASAATADQQLKFRSYRLLHESVGPGAVYRRFRWSRNSAGVVQHQLFVDGLVVTCSRGEDQLALDEVFGLAIRSFRARSGETCEHDPEG